MKKFAKLSPAMIDCIRWLAGDRRPGLLWGNATLDALVRRGLIKDLSDGKSAPRWDVSLGVEALRLAGIEVVIPAPEPTETEPDVQECACAIPSRGVDSSPGPCRACGKHVPGCGQSGQADAALAELPRVACSAAVEGKPSEACDDAGGCLQHREAAARPRPHPAMVEGRAKSAKLQALEDAMSLALRNVALDLKEVSGEVEKVTLKDGREMMALPVDAWEQVTEALEKWDRAAGAFISEVRRG